MSELPQQSNDFSGKQKHSKLRFKKSSIHIDMTPMVDLAFLLLTFFMLTTTLKKQNMLLVTMPPRDVPKPVKESETITILLTDNNRIIWYKGEDDPVQEAETNIADFSGNAPNSIHKVLLEKNKLVLDKIEALKDSVYLGLIPNDRNVIRDRILKIKNEEKHSLLVLIKPDNKSKYRNLVDILDEILICQVTQYAILDVSQNELDLIKRTN